MIAKRAQKLATVSLLVAAAVFSSGCPVGGGTGIVLFKDPVLEDVIRFELGIPLSPYVTQVDMLDLTSLEARGFGIRDLQGLQFARNLTRLDLELNNVSDIEALTNLVNLRFLNLADNQLTDIVPVAGLFNLDELVLHENNIVNIAPIVANAVNGGLGPGDSVTLNPGPIFDDEGNTSLFVAEQIAELVERGVDVVFLVPEGAE